MKVFYDGLAENPITILKGLSEENKPLKNWDLVPFVSLTVVDGDSECPEDHPNVVVYNEFAGLD